MIRSFFAVLFVVIYFIIMIPVCGILWLIGRKNPKGAEKALFATAKWILKLVVFISGTKVTINGRENLPNPKDAPKLFIANHNSIFDVVLMYVYFAEAPAFIAKNSLKKVPVLSMIMSRLKVMFLDRSDVRDGMRVIMESIDYINKGENVFVFPEGTRSKDGNMLPFKEGSFKIATKTDCPIVPVAITNTANILEAHMPFIRSAKVVVTFLPPVSMEDIPAEEKKHIGAYVQSLIATQLEADSKLLQQA